MSSTKRAVAACSNSQFLTRLSIERCRAYVSHMQAVLHVCDIRGEDVTEALHQMMNMLDQELSQNLHLRP
ncbi:MAG: hypothetical protein ACK4NR_10430 [Micavibrio sp.]